MGQEQLIIKPLYTVYGKKRFCMIFFFVIIGICSGIIKLNLEMIEQMIINEKINFKANHISVICG